MKISRNRLRRIIREQLLTEKEASPEDVPAEEDERETEEPADEDADLEADPPADDPKEEAPLRGRQRRLARRAGRKGGRARGATGDRRDRLEAEVEELEAEIAELEAADAEEAEGGQEVEVTEKPTNVVIGGTDVPADDFEWEDWDETSWAADDDKWPLTQGEHGDAVKQLQVAVGVEPDGYYGGNTATAVAKHTKGDGEYIFRDDYEQLIATKPGEDDYTPATGGSVAPAEAEEEVEEQVEDHVEKIGRYIGTQAGATEDQMNAVVAIKRGYEENGSEGAMDAVAEIGTEYATDKLQGLLDDMEVELDADDLVGAAKGVWDSAFGTEEEKLLEGFYRRNMRGHRGRSVSRAQLRSMILREMLKRQ